MPQGPREHYRADGTAKRGFRRRHDAVINARRSQQDRVDGRRSVAYKCKICGLYHVGGETYVQARRKGRSIT